MAPNSSPFDTYVAAMRSFTEGHTGELPCANSLGLCVRDKPMSFAARQSNAENQVINRVCFTTFDFLHDVPKACALCNSNAPIFRFAFADDENERAEYMKILLWTMRR